jgi:hypothetical protein
MEDFTLYFQLGWNHIISFDALDHLLFIAALTCLYNLSDWRRVLILITAFTVGHSLTLALSSLNITKFNNNWIEFLIPLTIVITCVNNLFQSKINTPGSIQWNYLMALCFGLIHGMGFANTIRFMLAKAQNITNPLLSFNIGIEVGQAIIVMSILYVTYIFTASAGLKQRWWTNGISVICGIIGLCMCASRLPF